MNRIISLLVVVFFSVLAARPDITVNFPVTDTTLRHLRIITLDFTIDGAGSVTLDAQSSNGGAAPQAVVNAWDGPVDSVTNAALFNTSFTLTGVAKLNGVQIDQLSTQAGSWGPGLHVNGLRINHELTAAEIPCALLIVTGHLFGD